MGTFDPDHDYSVTFPTYTILQEHIRTVHPPKCPNCPIVCSTSRELRRHLEVAHGDVSLEERKVFPCTIGGCDRSFTKKGNLTVHIRTVHRGEKRFGCGETDLSASKKVEGWDGIGCGKRYGSKLALEEHIRTAHLGYQNAKAERRQRLGIDNSSSASHISTLAALTGQGYAEETGRHISCFYDSCEHRFHRDYDLWVHMTAKHGCSEDEVQGLFMQRALLSNQTGSGGNALSIYGLEFDQSEPSHSHGATPPNGVTSNSNLFLLANDSSGFPQHNGLDSDFLMQDTFSANAERNVDSMIPSHDEMALMDPVLAYHLMER
jgi:general transcription factor IIIA